MSRHLFFTTYNDELVSVLMGWDKNNQGFFMRIHKPDSKDKALLYDHLTTREPFPKSLRPFLEVLNRFCIHLPLEMVKEVADDRENQLNDKDVTHHLINGHYVRQLGIDESLL